MGRSTHREDAPDASVRDGIAQLAVAGIEPALEADLDEDSGGVGG